MSKPHDGHGYIDFVGDEEHFWRIETLWSAADGLPVREVPLDDLPWDDDGCHVLGDPPTWGALARHCKRAMECDTSHPIILNVNGDIMDGMHRIMRAFVCGQVTVPAVQLRSTPPPDRVRPR